MKQDKKQVSKKKIIKKNKKINKRKLIHFILYTIFIMILSFNFSNYIIKNGNPILKIKVKSIVNQDLGKFKEEGYEFEKTYDYYILSNETFNFEYGVKNIEKDEYFIIRISVDKENNIQNNFYESRALSLMSKEISDKIGKYSNLGIKELEVYPTTIIEDIENYQYGDLNKLNNKIAISITSREVGIQQEDFAKNIIKLNGYIKDLNCFDKIINIIYNNIDDTNKYGYDILLDKKDIGITLEEINKDNLIKKTSF